MKLITIIAVLIVNVISQWSLNNRDATLSSYNTLEPGVTYDLTFSLDKTITSGSTAMIAFESQFRIPPASLSNCQASLSQTVTPAAATCSATYSSGIYISNSRYQHIQSSGIDRYSIMFPSLYTGGDSYQNYLRLKFIINNPWKSGSSTITLDIKDASSIIIQTTSFYIDYSASVMSACSFNGVTSITGDNVIHTVKFTPQRDLIAGSTIKLSFPYWFGTTSNNAGSSVTCTGIQSTDSASLPCTMDTINSTYESLNINNFVSTNKTAPTNQIQIQIDKLRNPWSLAPFGEIIVQIYYNGGNGGSVTQMCNGIYQTVTQLNTFKGSTFNLSNFAISTQSINLQLILSTQNPLAKNKTRLRIQYSSQITVAYTGASGSVASQSLTQLILTSIATTDKSSGTLSLLGFQLTTPPSTRPFTLKFTNEYLPSGTTVYDIQTISRTYQNNPGVITSVSAITITDTTINAVTDYQISFKTTNKMKSGSFVTVNFPSTLSVDMTATCTSSVPGSACVVTSTTVLTITMSAVISPATTFSLTITKVKNSPQSTTSATFKIYSYYDSLTDSLVDQLISGLVVTMTPNQISTATVTPSIFTTYTTTSYKFDFVLKDDIYQNGYMQIEFPASVTPIAGSIALAAASFTTTTCAAVSLNGLIAKISGCFPSAAMTTRSTSVTLNGIRNPPSYKPSDSFKIRTFSSTNNLINSISSGLTVTMTNAYALSTFSINPQSNIVHANTIQTIDIVHAIPLSLGDYVVLNFDQSMTISAGISCAGILGITTVNCIRVSNYRLKIVYTATPSSQTLQYQASTVMNYDVGDTTLTFDITSYTSEDFIKQKGTTTQTYSQAPLTAYSVNFDDKIIVLSDSQITLTISTPFTLAPTFDPTKTKLEIYLPAGVTAETTSTCTTIPSSGTCTKTSTTKFQIASIGLTVSGLSIVLSDLLLPLINVQTGSFSLVYTYNTQNVSFVDSGVVIKTFCTSPCKACSVTQTKCVNCLPAPNTLLYFDQTSSSCSTACLDGTYPDSNKVCQSCVPPCSKCVDAAKCSSCVANKWLSGTNCVDPCPDTTFKGTGVCTPCQDPCNNCQSLSQCLSCKTGFYSNFNCVTEANCPTNTYADTTTLNCEPCKSPCLQCSKQQDNCTSCIVSFFYYNNKCVDKCIDGMYASGQNCLSCVGLCKTCTSPTYCLTCLSDYYYNGQCLASTNCPAGTFADTGNMKCTTCPVGCTGCISLAQCTSCDNSIYVFYQKACVATCPDGTFKSSITCQPCVTPCVNCFGSANKCLSCNAGVYLYNLDCVGSCPVGMYEDINKCTKCKVQCEDCEDGLTCTKCTVNLFLTLSGQCLSGCPVKYYANTLNSKCDPCQSPCSQCSLTGSNCTTCITGKVLYVNDCSSSTCPSQYFNVSGVCKTCSNCLNCISEDTCSKCKAGMFLYAGACYVQCPTTAPIIDLINQKCTVCDKSCLKCSSSQKNCTSCNQGQYLLNSGCYSACPSGYAQNMISRSCEVKVKQITSIFLFPNLFGVIAVVVIALYSKYTYGQTQFITFFTSMVSVFAFISWIVLLIVLAMFQFSLSKDLVNMLVVVIIAAVVLGLVYGIGYQIYLKCTFSEDAGFRTWIQHSHGSNYLPHKVVMVASLFNFILYRFLYSRLFHRIYFTLYYSNGQKLLTSTHRLALLSIASQLLPIIGISFYTIYNKQIYDQTVYSALDALIINVILIILLFIDGSKSGQQFFGKLKGDLPFKIKDQQTRGKQYLEVDSNSSIADLSQYEPQNKMIKTQIDEKEKENYFRKITCVDNLNKFGHLNQVLPKQEENTKSIPQLKDLRKLPPYQFNPIGNHQDNVVDDLFFQSQAGLEEQKLRFQETQRIKIQLEQKALQQEEQKKKIQQRKQEEKEKEKKQEKQQQRRIQQKIAEQEKLQRQRLQKLLEDQLQQQNLQCVDMAAIDKAENKNNKNRKSPLQFLSKCKTVDDKLIDQKAVKKLQDIAKKNGIDPEFMKQTFGVQKNHNQDLLNSIIDKHHHVDREAVKQMFKQTNNKEVLQQLFSKNSTVDTEKLKSMMNDKEGLKMIQKLMDQEKGIVSADIAKALFDKNSKFKPEFTKTLLSGESGADDKKLQQLLKTSQGGEKAREQNLKALKKVGGQSLKNKQLMQNMLGQESKLDPQQFSKVANNLSMKALQSLFNNKSPQSQKVVDKILNNKKLNLKQLSPILEDEQLVYELGQLLGNGNPILQENIMNLLKNSVGTADPQKLKQLLQNQNLLKKLMSDSVIDPQFLTEFLKKDGNSSIELLQKTLNEMSKDDIKKVFQFTGDKNIDYKNLTKIFQDKDSTDPQLVKKMMDPQLIEEVFTKNNNVNSNMLAKLVEKGSKFDKDNIVNIYGKNTDNVFNNTNGKFNRDTKYKNLVNNNNNLPNGQNNNIYKGADGLGPTYSIDEKGNYVLDPKGSLVLGSDGSYIQKDAYGPNGTNLFGQTFSLDSDGNYVPDSKGTFVLGAKGDYISVPKSMLNQGSSINLGPTYSLDSKGNYVIDPKGTLLLGSNGDYISKDAYGPNGMNLLGPTYSLDQEGNYVPDPKGNLILGSNGSYVPLPKGVTGQNGINSTLGPTFSLDEKGNYVLDPKGSLVLGSDGTYISKDSYGPNGCNLFGQTFSLDQKGNYIPDPKGTFVVGSKGDYVSLPKTMLNQSTPTNIGPTYSLDSKGNYVQDSKGTFVLGSNGDYISKDVYGPNGMNLLGPTYSIDAKGNYYPDQNGTLILGSNGKYVPLPQNIVNSNVQNGNKQNQMFNGSFYNGQQNETEYDFKYTFNKTANQNFNKSEQGQVKYKVLNNNMIMSRTDGGIMGFLNPLKIRQQKDKLKASMDQRDEFDDLQQKLQGDQDQFDDIYRNNEAILQQEDQDGNPINRRRKGLVKKRKLKKITDIRHPAQRIYLEPIIAPHQLQASKSFRKKKKRDHNQSATKLIMDQDNDVFDIDF